MVSLLNATLPGGKLHTVFKTAPFVRPDYHGKRDKKLNNGNLKKGTAHYKASATYRNLPQQILDSGLSLAEGIL